MNGEFTENLYSKFFICKNEEALILIIPFLFIAITSDQFLIKIGVDFFLFLFSFANILKDFYFISEEKQIPILHYDLLILCFFSFLHILLVMKTSYKRNKMLSFIEEKQYLKTKDGLKNNINNDSNLNKQGDIGFFSYEIFDVNNFVINKKIKEDILNKIYLNFFVNNFSNLEFTCLTSPAKIRVLGIVFN